MDVPAPLPPTSPQECSLDRGGLWGRWGAAMSLCLTSEDTGAASQQQTEKHLHTVGAQ